MQQETEVAQARGEIDVVRLQQIAADLQGELEMPPGDIMLTEAQVGPTHRRVQRREGLPVSSGDRREVGIGESGQRVEAPDPVAGVGEPREQAERGRLQQRLSAGEGIVEIAPALAAIMLFTLILGAIGLFRARDLVKY